MLPPAPPPPDPSCVFLEYLSEGGDDNLAIILSSNIAKAECVGGFLDFVSLATRTPHGGASYVWLTDLSKHA